MAEKDVVRITFKEIESIVRSSKDGKNTINILSASQVHYLSSCTLIAIAWEIDIWSSCQLAQNTN